jgi:hypothetical protein
MLELARPNLPAPHQEPSPYSSFFAYDFQLSRLGVGMNLIFVTERQAKQIDEYASARVSGLCLP